MQLLHKNSAVLSVLFTKNNILCTLSNLEGKTLISISVGAKKIKSLKKITNTNLFSMIKVLNFQIEKLEITFIYLRFKGINKSKNDFYKLLKNTKVIVLLIQNQLQKSYGGCKKSKSRKI